MAKARARLTVTPQRRRHILDGDLTGGGHGPGRGISGKSEFPATLSDDDIINGIEAILNDPAMYPGGAIPTSGPAVKLVGMIGQVPTVVIADPPNRGVRTAYPHNVKPNP
jgi:hypothetical protein